ncbi:aminopeptidase [Halorubellus salinus]|uniref:aminopeptidase n=1 Tax=Halorubellus salinus TaxID=755309 RepID=UPI001D086343|nr:aminopeptidase [Halorubellus salinus]
MDERLHEHAEIIVDHCTRVEPGDNVLVQAPTEAEDLGVAVMEKLGDIGATATLNLGSSRASRAYQLAMDDDDWETPEHVLAMAEKTDVSISIRADSNTFESSDVPPETNQARQQEMRPLMDEMMDKRWLLTQYPAPGNAQDAEMSTEAYADFVFDAVNKDWDEQEAFQANMVEILDDADEVRIVSGDTTDVTMSVGGNPTKNDWAEHNLPGGEVFTAPRPESVEGEVLFDMPVMVQSREITNVRLVFEGGEVVEHSADKNEEVLTSVLNTDEGAKRLGELGIGMNRDIDRFTYNMLFDEKMGDTVHMAIGRAYDDTVGEDNEVNQSAVHQDMIVDMSEDSRIEVDGEVVQRNGTFKFEDGFEEEA